MANNKIQLGNGTVLLDLTGDTVRADKLARGYTAHDKSGAQITGTLDDGGGGTDHDFVVTVDMDLETSSISNQSATLAEIAAAAAENKDVRLYAISTLYDGVARIYITAHLIECDVINMGGSISYKVVFVTDIIDGDEVSQVTIVGATGQNNDLLQASSRDVSDPPIIKIVHSGAVITSVNPFNLDKVLGFISSGKGGQISCTLQEQGGTSNLYLPSVSADAQQMHLRFYAEDNDNGIGYAINMQVYTSQDDIPSGAFVLSMTIDEDTVYVGVMLHRTICAPVVIEVYTVNDEIVGHHLPDRFLDLLQISLSNADMFYLSVRHIVIVNGNVASTLYLQGTLYNNSDGSLIYSYPFPGATSLFKMQIVQSEPESGYYVPLGNGQYLVISIIQN